jgi:hypothetical protein
MHIHGNPMQFNAVNLHTVAAAEKTAATQRATDVRKMLLNGDLNFENEFNTESGLVVARQSGGDSYQQGRNQGETAPNLAASASGEESEQAVKPVSFWA